MLKRALFMIGATLLFLNTFSVPSLAHADGGAGSTSCNGTMCKP
jgi:hypothetical protein